MSVLPCASAPVHCRLITAQAHAQQNVKAAPILLGAVCGRRRSVGNAPWRSRGPAQLAGCLEEPGLCLRVDSGGGCRRSGRILAPGFCIWMPGWASRDGPQAKEEIPVQWENMQASGVASWGALGGRWCCLSLAWLVLPFFPALLVLLDRNTTRGTWPPPTPGGEWRGRGKPSSKSLRRDLLSKASMLAFSSPVCAPFSLMFNAGPCLPACLPAASPCALAGGIHGGRMSPMPGFSTDGILLRCILPNIASLRIFSSHAHGKRKNQPPTTATGTPAVQKEGHCRGDAEVVMVVPRPRLLLRTLFASSSAGDVSGCVPHPIPPAGWAGLGWVWCVCGGAGLWWPKSHPQPTTSLPVRDEPQAGAAASKPPQQAEEASRRCNFTSPQAFGSPSPTSPSAHLVYGRRAGETLPHTPPHRRGRDGAQQRGRFRERSGVRGIEEPRSPLAVAIGRIILDAGRRSKPSFPLGAACAEPPSGPCVDRTRWREWEGRTSQRVLCVPHREKTRSARGSHSAGRTGP